MLPAKAPLELVQGQMLLQPGWREPGCFPIDFCSLKEGGNSRSYRAGKVKGRELEGALNTVYTWDAQEYSLCLQQSVNIFSY